MSAMRRGHGVEDEPWNTGNFSTTDHVGHEPAYHDEHLFNEEEEAADHTVWDEPVARAIGEPPSTAYTYATWYRRNLDRVGAAESWAIAVTLAFIGGFGAVLGVFWTSYSNGTMAGTIIAMALVGPLMEELLKIGAALMVLERRPFYFRTPVQLYLVTISSTLMFAVIENLLYVYFYFPDRSASFVFWRWSVCTTLHIGATAVATLGLVRMWRAAQPETSESGDYERPKIDNGYKYFIAAIVIHGVYNASVIIAEASGFAF